MTGTLRRARRLAFPGRSRAFTWEAPDFAVPSEAQVRRVLEATLAALGPLLRPRTAELHLHCIDPGLRDPVEGAALVPPSLLATPSDADALDRQALLHWIDDAVAQVPCPAPALATWSELRFDATLSWVDDDGPTELELHDEDTLAPPRRVPLTRLRGTDGDGPAGLWIAGPIDRDTVEPPLALSLAQLGATLVMTLTSHWSCWVDPAQPGTLRLQAALARLLQLGWTDEIARPDGVVTT